MALCTYVVAGEKLLVLAVGSVTDEAVATHAGLLIVLEMQINKLLLLVLV